MNHNLSKTCILSYSLFGYVCRKIYPLDMVAGLCHFVISLFPLFSWRYGAAPNDERRARKDEKNAILNSYFSSGVFLLFRFFAWRPFVISSFCLAFFRFFVFLHGIFSFFCLFTWCFFVLSSHRLALWQGEKTK